METLIQILILFLKCEFVGPCGSIEVLLAPMFSTFTNHHIFSQITKSTFTNHQISKYENLLNSGSLPKSPNFLHLVLSEPSPVLGGYPVWWVKDQCWVLL
jgi:hypothetical protein